MDTNQLKEQARKEFFEDERFKAITRLLGWYESDANNIKIIPAKDDPRPDILSFIDSLIDRTVQMTEERIVEIIRKENHELEEWYSSAERSKDISVFDANQRNIKTRNNIISLITKKNDLSGN